MRNSADPHSPRLLRTGNDDTTRHWSAQSVCVLAFRLRQDWGGQGGLAFPFSASRMIRLCQSYSERGNIGTRSGESPSVLLFVLLSWSEHRASETRVKPMQNQRNHLGISRLVCLASNDIKRLKMAKSGFLSPGRPAFRHSGRIHRRPEDRIQLSGG